VVKRVFGIGEHGAEAHFVVGFERWGRPWGGAGIEFRTDSEQMGRSLDEISAEQIEQELMRQVVDGKDSEVTFDEFPYYIR